MKTKNDFFKENITPNIQRFEFRLLNSKIIKTILYFLAAFWSADLKLNASSLAFLGDENPAPKIENMVRMKLSGTYGQDETVIYTDSSASDLYDEQFDAIKMLSPNAGVPNIYCKAASADLSINVLGKFSSDKEIPIELSIKAKGSYKLEITDFIGFDSTAAVYLEDRLKGIYHDIRISKIIEETFPMGLVKGRFFLHYYLPIDLKVTHETCNQNDGKITIINPSANPWNYTIKSIENNYFMEHIDFRGEQVLSGLKDGIYNLNLLKSSGYNVSTRIEIKGGSDLTQGFIAPEKPVAPGSSVEFSTLIKGADVTYCWHFGDGESLKGNYQFVKHVYRFPGIYQVSLCVTDGKCTLTYEKTIIVDNNPTLIADPSDRNTNFSIYPNPVSDILNLKIEGVFNGLPERIEIFDACGSLIRKYGTNDVIKGESIQLPVQELINGTYLIVVSGSGERLVRQMIVAH